MKKVLGIRAAGLWARALLMGLLMVAPTKADIVDGIRALGDSIAIWQVRPPAWTLADRAEIAHGVTRDTLDARGDSVWVRYPALYEDRFVSGYVEVGQAGQKRYLIPSAWQNSVWTVSNQAVGTVDQGWGEPILQAYVRDRLLQLRLLLHADLEMVPVPLLSDTVSVAFTLVGRDIQRFSLSHGAAMSIVRHIGGGALGHAFFTNWRDDGNKRVVEWVVFIRSGGASSQHVLVVEDRLEHTAGAWGIEKVAMRFLPGVRMDNVDEVMAKDTTQVTANRQRWNLEIREESE